MPVAAVTMSEQERLRVAADTLVCIQGVDEHFPTVDDKFSLLPGWAIKGSGGAETDYPDLRPRGLNLQFFSIKKKVPIPSPILEAQSRASCTAMSGVFPEIHRAWATVDSDIYLWRYEDGRDVAAYTALKEAVLALGVVVPSSSGDNPAPGNPSHSILVAVTATKIQLLTMSFNAAIEDGNTDRFGLINIGQESILTLATDGVVYDVVHGTSNGRLFLGGRDGNLYEIIYAKKSRWGSSVGKVNHSSSALFYLVPGFLAPSLLTRPDPIAKIASDDSRKTLFTLSSRGGVIGYYMGANGDSLTRIGALTEDQITRSILEASGYGAVERQGIGMLVDITAVTTLESYYMHLVGVTDAGIRVYFTCTPDINPANHTPYDLKIVHVRLPPGFAANAGPHRPRSVRQAHSCRGITLMSAANPPQWPDQLQFSNADSGEALWAISSDLHATSPHISESFEIHRFEGVVKGLVEVPDASVKDLVVNRKPLPPTNVLLQLARPRNYVVLTSEETVTVEALRPLDQLESMLTNQATNVENSSVLRAFFDLLGVDQACVLALSLACGVKHTKGGVVAEKAARAVLAFGCNSAATIRAGHMSMSAQNAAHSQMHQIQQQSRYPMGSPTPFASPGQSQQAMVTPAKRMGPYASTPYPAPMTPQQTPVYPYAMSPSPSAMQGSMITELRSCYSSLHTALYVYLWRLARPVAMTKAVGEKHLGDGKTYHINLINDRDATYAISEFNSLLKFLRTKCDLLKASIPASAAPMGLTNRSMAMEEQRYSSGMAFSPMVASSPRMPYGSPYPTAYGQGSVVGMPLQQYDVTEADIRRAERASIQNLEILTDRLVQVLELWRILTTHPFHQILEDAPDTTKGFLRNAHILDLAIDGQSALSDLINALTARYLKEGISIEGLSNILRKLCPKVYREEEAKCARVSELLHTAANTENQYERMKIAEDALSVAKSIALGLNIVETCGELARVGCFRHIVDLCAAAGRMVDPDNRALRYYREHGENDYGDPESRELLRRRTDMYKPIIGVLNDLLVQSKTIPHRSGGFSLLVARNTAFPNEMRQKWVPNENDASQGADEIIRAVTREKDELLIVEIFKFLLEEGLSRIVLDLRSEYLGDFLTRLSKTSGASRLVLENLWRLHEREGAYEAAASVLLRLAERRGGDITLSERIMYLGKALSCLKGRRPTSDAATATFLNEIQDKMDVARIQRRVLSAIEEKPEISPAAKARLIAELNQELHDIVALFQKYAVPLELFDCILAIMFSAHHTEPSEIKDAWFSLINHEFRTSNGLSSAERVTRLRAKFQGLANEFGSKPAFVPFKELAEFLEEKSFQLRLYDDETLVGWVWKMLKDCGISLEQLGDIYRQLHDELRARSITNGQFFAFQASLSRLLEVSAKEVVSTTRSSSGPLRQQVLDLAMQMYVDLQILGAGNREANSILIRIANVQNMLKKGGTPSDTALWK